MNSETSNSNPAHADCSAAIGFIALSVKPNATLQTEGHAGTSGKPIDFEARRKRVWRGKQTAKRLKQISRTQSKRISDNLTDGYLRGRLARELNIPGRNISPEQISAKRASLTAKRLKWEIKKLSTENQ